MYTLFYILGYLAVLGFVCLAVQKIHGYIKASPMHIRWELYPIPHEGPKRYEYGGSYMEDTNWWQKPRHVDHCMDIKEMVKEVLCLHSTYEHNPKLWIRTYPFHMGLYLLMGGTILLICAVILELLGVPHNSGFMKFIANVINAISLFGAFGIAGGGIALILRRMHDKGLNIYTTREQYFNLGAFVLFALLTLCAWTFNPSYFDVASKFIHNLFTVEFTALGSTWFVLSMLVGFAVLIWIPLTNMRHVLIKYFMYHDIRWGDTSTVWSEKNRELIGDVLKYNVTWSADHINPDGKPHNWVEVATSNPAEPKKD